MCGIIGICSKQAVAPMIIESLMLLEYRGYDSAGIAINDDSRLQIIKDTGKVKEIEARYHLSRMKGNTGIGHTRWATHGSVIQKNAHPHCDCTGKIAVVHNGIIDNYRELKEGLSSRGHRFISETDTEVIPHLVEEEVKAGKTLEKAVMVTARRLKGSYAFLVIHSDEFGTIVGTKKKIPLIIGKNNCGVFVASDVLAFAAHVNKVIPLEDGEVVRLSETEVSIFDNEGRRLKKLSKPSSIHWNDVGKNGYPHFMLKEIMEQPQVIEKVVTQDKKLFEDVGQEIMEAKQVIITACGTSRYAALVGSVVNQRNGTLFEPNTFA